MREELTKADYALFVLVIILIPWLYATLWGNSSMGTLVQINIANGDSFTLPLDQNKRIEVEGAIGTSIIEVKDRQVRFIESPCQNKQCVITGWLASDGELAACMPNGVSVQIKGRDTRFDSLNF